jgi:hypothetical protein
MGSATLNGFAIDQIEKARYGVQHQTYTYGPTTLPVGQSTIFQVQNWNTQADGTAKVCVLTDLAATQNSAAQLQWMNDSQQSDQAQGWTDGYPANMLPYPTFVVAGKNLKLVANNMSGAPINNFQLNYGLAVLSLNLFQRLLYGFSSNAADQAALNSLQQDENQRAAQRGSTPQNINNEISRLLSSGHRPFSLESVIKNLLDNRRITNPKDAVPFHMTIAANATASPTKNINVGNGDTVQFVYVLKGISLEGATAGLTLTIDRDNDVALVNQLNAAAYVQVPDIPWQFFIPAKDHFGVTINGNPGTYPVRLDIEAYQASDLMIAHLTAVGQTGMGSITPKTQVGLQ